MPRKAATTTTPATPRTLATPEAIAKRFEDFPAIKVLARRLVDPTDPTSQPILLHDESPDACVNSDHQRRLKPGATTCHLCKRPARIWHLHTCNTAIEGRWAQMKSKGYEPVRIEELSDPEDIGDLVRQEEKGGGMYVRRGDRGREIMMKQPLEAYNYIKRLQADQRNSRLQSVKAQREDLAEAVGRSVDQGGLGDEAGERVHRGGIQIETMQRTSTTLAEEAGE